MGTTESRRSVLIIDEYDRLFGRLRAAGRGNEDLRHLVIQPFLDQCVEFATDNLIVLLGQHPNAHYIFMDQNQLSAYVQQQPYPLFEHAPGASHGEFWDLLSKVFQQTLRFEPSFADAVFQETAGHPFLTVNLLRDFVDWLIKKKVVPASTRLSIDHFDEFRSTRLDRRAVGSSIHYEYFRSAAGEALSSDGERDSPWIFAVYHVLRMLARGDPETLSLARDDLENSISDVLDRAGLSTYSVDSFLTSAVYSNFLQLHEGIVSPRIRLLARLADTTRGR